MIGAWRPKLIIQNSVGLGQKRTSVKCVALPQAILLFVLHIISRGPNAIHSEPQKALLPLSKVLPCSWSPAFIKTEKKLWTTVLSYAHRKKNCFLINLSVRIRQCKLWKWQSHLSSDHKTWSWYMIWVPLWSSKGCSYRISWRFIKS